MDERMVIRRIGKSRGIGVFGGGGIPIIELWDKRAKSVRKGAKSG